MSNLGTDFYCVDDITFDWKLADSEEQAFMQALYRRLYLTGLFYSVYGYGLGVERWLLDVITPAQMTGQIQSQLMLDERVRDVLVTWADSDCTINVTAHSGQAFTLTIEIDAVAATLQLPESE